MRGEVTGALLWLVLVFLVGTVVGRFVIPVFEPKVTSYVAIAAEPGVQRCTLDIEHETTVLGRRTSLVDETESLTCSQSRGFAGTSIQCRCAK